METISKKIDLRKNDLNFELLEKRNFFHAPKVCLEQGQRAWKRKLLDHIDNFFRKLQILFFVCEIVVLIVGFLRAFDSKNEITTHLETLKHIM